MSYIRHIVNLAICIFFFFLLVKAISLFFSSPELKAQVSYSDRPLSVCLSVCLSVNFYIFNFFFRTTGPILTKLGTDHPWGEGIQVFFLIEGDCLSPMGDNSETVKIH
jgi:hypothetical protein